MLLKKCKKMLLSETLLQLPQPKMNFSICPDHAEKFVLETKFVQVSAAAYILKVNSHQTTIANTVWLILLENYFLPYYSPIR